MSRRFFRDGRPMFEGLEAVPAKVIPIKPALVVDSHVTPHLEPITQPKEKSEDVPFFNVIPLINMSDRRVLKMDSISTKQLALLGQTDIIMVVIPGAIVFVPKPYKKYNK